MKEVVFPVKVLFHREEGAWFAHCLDFDLRAQDKVLNTAIQKVCEQACTYVESAYTLGGGTPTRIMLNRKAPWPYWVMFYLARILRANRTQTAHLLFQADAD